MPCLPQFRASDSGVCSLADLLFLGPDDLAGVHLAYVNLLCATGLPDTDGLDVFAHLRVLSTYVDAVRT